MKAMIFAAGLGTRLGKITENIPKALVDINGKTALQIAVEKCHKHGFNDLIINVHYFADQVEKEIEKLINSGYNISVSDEREMILDTGGGLYKARDFFDNSPFLIYNVDIISDLDLSSFYQFHLEKQGIATLAVSKREGNRFFLVNESGLIKGWCNNSTGERILPANSREDLTEIAFSGIHVVEPEIFKYMEKGVYSMTELYLKLSVNHKINTYRDDNGLWVDIGTPESLEYVRSLFRVSRKSV